MQKQIELTDKTVLVVGLKKATYIAFIGAKENELIVRMGYEFHQEQEELKLPKGDWQLVGIHPELTEEECKRVVEKVDGLVCSYFKNYTTPNHSGKFLFNCKTAKESFDTLMKKIECYTVNPLSFDPTGITTSEWQEAEKSTFKKFAILIKKNG